MNQTELQRLSDVRIREAKILFAAAEYSGSYYLAGYATECALKACYEKSVKKHDFPDKNSAKIFTHNLTALVDLANLKKELLEARQANSKFASGWDLVCRWTEESRYFTWTRDDVETILDAIIRRRDGVLPWIKRYW